MSEITYEKERNNDILTEKQKKYLPVKRGMDILLAGTASVLLAPFMGALAIAIKADSTGPVLFKQQRIGQDKEIFEIWKFRTMRTDTPKDVPTHLLEDPDAYITKVGHFLRKFSLDELPQFWQVLSGKLSLVGPRPALWNQDDLVAERDLYGANSIKPGITGWAQINGRDELEIAEKARLDGEYVRKMSLWMDMKCLFGTVGSVLVHDDVVEGGTGELHHEGKETIDGADHPVSSENVQKKIALGGAVMGAAAAFVAGIFILCKALSGKNKEQKKHSGKKRLLLRLVGFLAIAEVIFDQHNKRKIRKDLEASAPLETNENVTSEAASDAQKTTASGASQKAQNVRKGRILFLGNLDLTIYNFRKELVERLLSEGYEVIVSSPDGERIKLLTDMGCQYVETKVNRHGTNPLQDGKLLLFYRRLMKEVQPDVICSYTIKPNIYGALAAGKQVPFVANITGIGNAMVNPGPLREFLFVLYRLAFRQADCVFFQNSYNRQLFLDHHLVRRNQARLLPGSGVNLTQHTLEPYPETAYGEDSFLYVGRIMQGKGIEELFEAARRIKQEFPKTTFSFVGFYEDEYEERMNTLCKEGIVTYHGEQMDVHPFMTQCNALILPSHMGHEGMANVLLEAAATGRPVLASRIPGCVETFEENETGLGFTPQDADDLYRAIRAFIELPREKKSAMGKAGRAKMEREFDRNIVVDAYMEEIKRCL